MSRCADNATVLDPVIYPDQGSLRVHFDKLFPLPPSARSCFGVEIARSKFAPENPAFKGGAQLLCTRFSSVKVDITP